MKSLLKNILKKSRKSKQQKFNPKLCYVVTAGDYLGKCLLFMSDVPNDNKYDVLAICQGRDVLGDGFEILEIPTNAVEEGLKNGIIFGVDTLPEDIYNIYYQEWLNRKNLKNDKFNN